jgi:hypothetical protein
MQIEPSLECLAQRPANTRPVDFTNPPSRFVRRCHSTEVKSETSPKPRLDLSKIAYNRSAYNRMIGEIVNMESDGHGEDLPDLAELGYTPEFMAQILGSIQ